MLKTECLVSKLSIPKNTKGKYIKNRMTVIVKNFYLFVLFFGKLAFCQFYYAEFYNQNWRGFINHGTLLYDPRLSAPYTGELVFLSPLLSYFNTKHVIEELAQLEENPDKKAELAIERAKLFINHSRLLRGSFFDELISSLVMIDSIDTEEITDQSIKNYIWHFRGRLRLAELQRTGEAYEENHPDWLSFRELSKRGYYQTCKIAMDSFEKALQRREGITYRGSSLNLFYMAQIIVKYNYNPEGLNRRESLQKAAELLKQWRVQKARKQSASSPNAVASKQALVLPIARESLRHEEEESDVLDTSASSSSSATSVESLDSVMAHAERERDAVNTSPRKRHLDVDSNNDEQAEDSLAPRRKRQKNRAPPSPRNPSD